MKIDKEDYRHIFWQHVNMKKRSIDYRSNEGLDIPLNL